MITLDDLNTKITNLVRASGKYEPSELVILAGENEMKEINQWTWNGAPDADKRDSEGNRTEIFNIRIVRVARPDYFEVIVAPNPAAL